MRLPTTRLFPLALMVSLALLTFYLERTVRVEEAQSTTRRHDPDYLLTNFTTTTFNAQGVAETMLSAAKMVHYPDDDSTELTAPRIVQSKPAEPRFSINADRGVLSSGGDEIFLYDNVILLRDADGVRPAARFTTSFLHVVRDRSLVRTDREIQIVEDRRSLTGRGMEYNNATSQFHLRNSVQARLLPPGTPE
jgi:lipopolysaccharide export system protein LptC